MSSSHNRPSGVGLVSLAALLALTVLVGCGSGSGSAGTSSQTTAASGASTSTAAPGSTGTQSTTSTSTGTSTSAHAPAKSTKAPVSGAATNVVTAQAGGHLLRRFTGSGNTHMGTIAVGSRQVLVWSARKPPIQIFTTHGFMIVSSHAPSGSVQLSQGTYPGMRVASHGAWTIELRAHS